MLFKKKAVKKPEVLEKKNIITGCASEEHEDVIRRVGRMLVENGYAKENYIEGMIMRDRSFSTAIGNHIAIPHGESACKSEITRTGLVVLTYPDGVEWGDGIVKLVVGIAAAGDEHLEVLGRIVEALEDEESVDALVERGDVDEIYKIFVTGE